MQSHSTYPLIQIGLCIRLLLHVADEASTQFVVEHFDMMSSRLKELGFRVSIAGIKPLAECIEKLKESGADTVSAELRSTLQLEMCHFERIVFAESETRRIYTFPDRRFNQEYLAQHPDKILRKGTYSKLSDMAKSDIDAACRCLLVGEGTATAFHILRATEEVLRQYYRHHKKQKRLTNPMWGPMTTELRAKRRNRPPDVVLDSLDLVRRSYRNPTQHPHATYDLESAQDFLGVCIDLVNKMVDEI